MKIMNQLGNYESAPIENLDPRRRGYPRHFKPKDFRFAVSLVSQAWCVLSPTNDDPYSICIDGTPIIDIKPIMKKFLPREGMTSRPHWATELMREYWLRKSGSEGEASPSAPAGRHPQEV